MKCPKCHKVMNKILVFTSSGYIDKYQCNACFVHKVMALIKKVSTSKQTVLDSN